MDLSVAHARPGDAVLLSGTIGDHGIALLSAGEGLELDGVIASECTAELLDAMRRHPLGIEAAIIGTVTDRDAGKVPCGRSSALRGSSTCWRAINVQDLLIVVC